MNQPPPPKHNAGTYPEPIPPDDPPGYISFPVPDEKPKGYESDNFTGYRNRPLHIKLLRFVIGWLMMLCVGFVVSVTGMWILSDDFHVILAFGTLIVVIASVIVWNVVN